MYQHGDPSFCYQNQRKLAAHEWVQADKMA